MFTRSARIYDAIYSFKDYAAAAAKLRSIVRRLNPTASSLLDVGCGTGRHLEHLQEHYQVEGLDVNAELLQIAGKRCPAVRFHQADMTDFDLDARFDVVTCLFSAIGYLKTVERLRQAVANMTRHLRAGGMIVIEPWFTPDSYWTGTITANFVDEPNLKIAWMYTSERVERLSVLNIHFLVGTPEGVEHFTELHEIGLFTDAEYRESLSAVGLEARYEAEGLFGRGLYLGLTPRAVAT